MPGSASISFRVIQLNYGNNAKKLRSFGWEQPPGPVISGQLGPLGEVIFPDARSPFELLEARNAEPRIAGFAAVVDEVGGHFGYRSQALITWSRPTRWQLFRRTVPLANDLVILEQGDRVGVRSIRFLFRSSDIDGETTIGFRHGFTVVDHSISSHHYFVFDH